MKTQLKPIANAKVICAYCSRGPAEGASLKRVTGLRLYYCENRKGKRVCR